MPKPGEAGYAGEPAPEPNPPESKEESLKNQIARLTQELVSTNTSVEESKKSLKKIEVELSSKQAEYDQTITGKQAELAGVQSKIAAANIEHDANIARITQERLAAEKTFRETHENLKVEQAKEVQKVQGIELREAEVKAQTEANQQEKERLNQQAESLAALQKDLTTLQKTIESQHEKNQEDRKRVTEQSNLLVELTKKYDDARVASEKQATDTSVEIENLKVRIKELEILESERVALSTALATAQEKANANDSYKIQLDEQAIRLTIWARALQVQDAQFKQREKNLKEAEAAAVEKPGG